VRGPLKRSVTLEQLTVVFLLAGVRRMMTRRMRMVSHKCLVGAASLGGGGGVGHILPVLGSLLIARIHPEIRHD
jgi:hypothetical protein